MYPTPVVGGWLIFYYSPTPAVGVVGFILLVELDLMKKDYFLENEVIGVRTPISRCGGWWCSLFYLKTNPK